jgi:hemerythrin-like metal-binding protein
MRRTIRGDCVETADSSERPMFEWSADYAMGIPQVDGEHQQLFVLAERLHRAMLEGNGKAILVDLLARLVDYTCYHFAHEEQLMERIQYPGYRQHQQEHRVLRSRVREMQDRAASGEMTMTIDVAQFLMEWLKSHIITIDRRIGNYMTTGDSRCLAKVRGGKTSRSHTKAATGI